MGFKNWQRLEQTQMSRPNRVQIAERLQTNNRIVTNNSIYSRKLHRYTTILHCSIIFYNIILSLFGNNRSVTVQVLRDFTSGFSYLMDFIFTHFLHCIFPQKGRRSGSFLGGGGNTVGYCLSVFRCEQRSLFVVQPTWLRAGNGVEPDF